MSERFRESDKAAGYVSAGLTHDFPDARLEVVRIPSKRGRQRACSTMELEKVLKELCRDFGQTQVDYHPNNTYGFVAELRNGQAGNGRPLERVVVLLTDVKGRPLAVGSRPTPRPTFELD